MSEYSIFLKGIHKSFPVFLRRDPTLLERCTSLFDVQTRHTKDRVQVLNDISFHVKKGEIIGIVGRNAVGKTTLMQIIAGIMKPDSGYVQTEGRVLPVFSLGAGIKERLSVLSNISLLCALYGMSRKEAAEKLESIIEFGELRDVLPMRVSQLSQGYKQRLAFSVVAQLQPDVLLLDEVFGAGDMVFREKAKQRIAELLSTGGTVLMVSHDTHQLEQNCDRVFWMHNGQIEERGKPKRVINAYKQYCASA